MSRRLWSVTLAAVLAAVLAAACGDGQPGDAEPLLTIAVKADTTGIFPNPPMRNEGYTIHINRNIFEGLVRFDNQQRVVPALAERWESPDERTYVFELDPQARFSHGRPLTSRDVVASFEATRRRGWPTASYLLAIESVQAIDTRRVEVRTRTPYFILLLKLASGFVLPAESLDQQPVPSIGTGPYRVARWDPGKSLELVANRHYRGPAPPFPRVRFVIQPDATRRLGLVESGAADIADNVPPGEIDRLRGRQDMRVVTRPSLRILFLCLRVDRTPFSDPRVREALDLALDRRELIERALGGLGEATAQVVPPAVVGFNPALLVTPPERERARQLLAEAGHADGLELVLEGPSNRHVDDQALLAEVARQLGEIGVRVRVETIDKQTFFDRILAGRSDFHLLSWACESGDAGDVLDAVFHSSGEGPYGTFNTTGLADPELDRLIEASNASHTSSERAALLRAAVARIAHVRPALPLLMQHETLLISRRVDWDPPLSMAFDLAGIRPARTGLLRR
jgi:peptide/nickel transport system substrate-binding protein